jgi:TraY domain
MARKLSSRLRELRESRVQVAFWMPKEDHARLTEAAEREMRSFTKEAIIRLRRSLNEEKARA